MKQIKITDTTLCAGNNSLSFKEKLEIARQLENLAVNVIEVPKIENQKTDILLIKTMASFVKKSVISVEADSIEGVKDAAEALCNAKNGRITIKLPTSPVGMEYTCHKKSDKMLEFIKELVSLAKEKIGDVEFCALDATRAEIDFLKEALKASVDSGANIVTICDTAAEMMPDDFTAFVNEVTCDINVPVNVSCENKNGLSIASAIMAVKNGVDGVKTSASGNVCDLYTFSNLIRNCGVKYQIESSIKITELSRTVNQIARIIGGKENADLSAVKLSDNELKLDQNDTQEDISLAVKKLGYDLSDDDKIKVYEEFLRVAKKKNVGMRELDAIVASVALQVPSTYQLVSYVINNGNIISASAQITLNKNGEIMKGVEIGDGPIDAAFVAIDSIIGHHYELDDFQIQSVTEGKEAMGSAIVKLRAQGKLYCGTGISTDIIGASIRAYLNAVNKIVYEEA